MDTPEAKTFGQKVAGFLGGLIPETVWSTLDTDRYEQVIDKLKVLDRDGIGPDLMAFIEKKKYKIGTLTQANSGAGWTVLGNITIRPDDVQKCLEPYVLSLILHEIFHVQQQSVLMRLSMRGELAAWQYQCRIYPLLEPGHEIAEAYGGRSAEWHKLSMLSADSRTDLEEARDLMIAIAPGYRAYALPIYPLHQEIGYYLRRGEFRGVIMMLQNLVRAARGQKVGRHSTARPG